MQHEKKAGLGESRGNSRRGNISTIKVDSKKLNVPVHWSVLQFYMWFYSIYKQSTLAKISQILGV